MRAWTPASPGDEKALEKGGEKIFLGLYTVVAGGVNRMVERIGDDMDSLRGEEHAQLCRVKWEFDLFFFLILWLRSGV